MNKPTKQQPVRVGMISLGCAKNLVDSEVMLGTLLRDGFEVTSDAARADVLIVNTCSFIDSAKEESVDAVLESAEYREAARRGQGLVVAGCMTQRYHEDLPKLLPEVDAFMGVDQVAKVTEIVGRALEHRKMRAPVLEPLPKKAAKSSQAKPPVSSVKAAPPVYEVSLRPKFIPDYATPRFRLTPRHLAYLKIAEGCNHPCSFCTIPQMRGSHRSRLQSDVVAEAKALLVDGVKELNLISQDSTYYGMDLRPNHSRAISSPEKFTAASKTLPAAAATLSTLIRELNGLPGDFWVRILYTHPAHWTDELIQTIASCSKVARYVDIPLQHIHSNMLERMRRETSKEHILDLMRRIRTGIPGISLRTTFIVGFPGETDEYFEELLDFIREAKFERLGVFTYSQEEGTRAGRMAGQISDKIKQQRREAAMAAQHEVAVSVSESFVGRTLRVLVERKASATEAKGARIDSWEHGLLRGTDEHLNELKGPYLIARGEADAPDIDGRVYVRGNLPVGQFAQVKILGHTDYDLIAEPAQDRGLFQAARSPARNSRAGLQ